MWIRQLATLICKCNRIKVEKRNNMAYVLCINIIIGIYVIVLTYDSNIGRSKLELLCFSRTICTKVPI